MFIPVMDMIFAWLNVLFACWRMLYRCNVDHRSTTWFLFLWSHSFSTSCRKYFQVSTSWNRCHGFLLSPWRLITYEMPRIVVCGLDQLAPPFLFHILSIWHCFFYCHWLYEQYCFSFPTTIQTDIQIVPSICYDRHESKFQRWIKIICIVLEHFYCFGTFIHCVSEKWSGS